MDKFVSTDILETIAGCSVIVTLLTQVFKKYFPGLNSKKLKRNNFIQSNYFIRGCLTDSV